MRNKNPQQFQAMVMGLAAEPNAVGQRQNRCFSDGQHMIEKNQRVAFKGNEGRPEKERRNSKLIELDSLNENYFQYAGEQNMVYQLTSRNSGTQSGKSSTEAPSSKSFSKFFRPSTLQTPESQRGSNSNFLGQAYVSGGNLLKNLKTVRGSRSNRMSFDEKDKFQNRLKESFTRKCSFLGVDHSIDEDILGEREHENEQKTKTSIQKSLSKNKEEESKSSKKHAALIGSQLFNMDYSSCSDDEIEKTSYLKELKDSSAFGLSSKSRICSDEKVTSNEFCRNSGESKKAEGQKSYRESTLDFLLEQSKESSSEHLESDDEDSKVERAENKIAEIQV